MEAVQVKERPWVVKQHEAQAIAAGRKTQLRILAPVFEGKDLDKLLAHYPNQKGCPLGEVGDRLRVREPWFPMRYDWREWDTQAPFLYSDGFVSNSQYWGIDYNEHKPPMGHAWKSAASMPRVASRLLLEITAVRVERVQAISEACAAAEGIDTLFSAKDLAEITPPLPYATPEASGWLNYLWHGNRGVTSKQVDSWPYQYSGYKSAKDSYSSLWAKINGTESWFANPWVWVVEFKVISPAATPTIQGTPTPATTPTL